MGFFFGAVLPALLAVVAINWVTQKYFGHIFFVKQLAGPIMLFIASIFLPFSFFLTVAVLLFLPLTGQLVLRLWVRRGYEIPDFEVATAFLVMWPVVFLLLGLTWLWGVVVRVVSAVGLITFRLLGRIIFADPWAYDKWADEIMTEESSAYDDGPHPEKPRLHLVR